MFTKRVHFILIFFFLGVFSVLTAQNKFTISGTIKDNQTGETMIGATVRVVELKGVGAAANEYGFYSLTLPSGNYTLLVELIGYKPQTKQINLDKNIKIDISLVENTATLNEVIVSATKADDKITNAQAGIEKIDIKEINKIPVLMGERDILKAIQLIPGIKSAGEGNAGFYVRGGAADQNLILLDEAPVYNAAHLLGFFSTFNSDAVKDATIYKGGMPSQYGGRLSSVLDIKMKDGNNERLGVSGGIGIISAKLNVEGPIQKGKSSFLISGRRTYADALFKASGRGGAVSKGAQLFFYDLNMKANYIFNDKNRVFLSGYFGRDKLGLKDLFGINWGNTTGTVRWNHVINDKMFSNTSLIYSDYIYKINVNLSADEITIASSIQDWTLKQEFQYFANPNNSLRFGFNSTYHTVTPGQIEVSKTSLIVPPKLQDRFSFENAVFLSNTWKATEKLNIIYGLRLSSFSILGKGDFYGLDSNHNVADTSSYSSGEFVKTYFNIEPRLSANYQLNSNSSIKTSYARNTQNMHLIANSISSSPTDKWVPSSKIIKPEISDQVSLGYFRNFLENKFEFSVEGYYKWMQNQIDYKDGADANKSVAVETELLFGEGRAYGVEFLFKKKYGKFTGWVGYTLSRTEKQIDGINKGEWYVAKQDKTHDLSIVGIYEISKRWTLSATWIYNTGNAVTFPSGKYNVANNTVFYYTERNGYRMPSNHRMDVSGTFKLKERKRFSSEVAISIYNVYARENAYVITFQQDPNDASKTQAVQTSLFRMVPSISYNFKF
ncbi:MAG: TonB-dependent receptor [Bacteroidia bacterium]